MALREKSETEKERSRLRASDREIFCFCFLFCFFIKSTPSLLVLKSRITHAASLEVSPASVQPRGKVMGVRALFSCFDEKKSSTRQIVSHTHNSLLCGTYQNQQGRPPWYENNAGFERKRAAEKNFHFSHVYTWAPVMEMRHFCAKSVPTTFSFRSSSACFFFYIFILNLSLKYIYCVHVYNASV